MTTLRITAIVAIYLLACMGWTILGTVTEYRSKQFGERLSVAVNRLWGTALTQTTPAFCVDIPGTKNVRYVIPTKNEINVSLDLEYRKKGLIWYSTYVTKFSGLYVISNNEDVTQKVRFYFHFPAADATYDEFSLAIDGKKVFSPIDTRKGICEIVEVEPGGSMSFQVNYRTRGLDEWRYRLAPSTGRVQNFKLVAKTNFQGVDYPEGSLSPMSALKIGEGMELTWQANDLITSQDIGIVVPKRINPGPLASRITFFAPVCLIFFFTLVAAINVVRKIAIHPMHYLFVASGFFAFHLLLAYLVDHLDVHLAFVVSAVTSVVLVTTYLTAALGERFPAFVAVVGQTFFLVLFSYSFFLEGATGLTVAIGSVLTLAILMKVTVHINWHEFFGKEKKEINQAQCQSNP